MIGALRVKKNKISVLKCNLKIVLQVGSKASVPVINIFLQLSGTVVLPLLIGQWLRRMLISRVDIKSIPWGQIGR